MAITILSESQIQSWQKHGYFLSDIVIGESVLKEMRTHFDMVFEGNYINEALRFRNWKPGDPPGRIRQAAYAWRTDPVLRSTALTPEIGAVAAQLAQTDTIRLLMDWIIYKPGIGTQPNPETGVGWHQDQNYWANTDPPKLLSARIPLDDETISNGCMTIIPGSHKWGLYERIGDGFWTADGPNLPVDIGSRAQGDSLPKVYELKKGQVMFHHCMLIHQSGQNRTDQPRRSQNIHMMPGETRFQSLGGDSFLEQYSSSRGQKLEEGQILEGELFPVVFSSTTVS